MVQLIFRPVVCLLVCLFLFVLFFEWWLLYFSGLWIAGKILLLSNLAQSGALAHGSQR